jgi:hypothetical protein
VMALRDVKLLEVKRPGQAHCRPQAGPGRDPRNHFLSAIHLWTAAPALAAGKAAPLKPLPDASGCAALPGEISGHHLPDGLFTVVHGGPEAGEAVAGCAEVPWRTANRRAIMVGRHEDFLAGLAAAVSGLAPDDRRSRAYWPHSSSTSLRGRSPPRPGCRRRRPDRRSASRGPAVSGYCDSAAAPGR